MFGNYFRTHSRITLKSHTYYLSQTQLNKRVRHDKNLSNLR